MTYFTLLVFSVKPKKEYKCRQNIKFNHYWIFQFFVLILIFVKIIVLVVRKKRRRKTIQMIQMLQGEEGLEEVIWPLSEGHLEQEGLALIRNLVSSV